MPVVPGSDGVVADLRGASEAAERIGFPVLVKAAGGGGGIGMAVAGSQAELEKAFRACADRARAAFGRDAVYLERYFPAPRHIEVQILGDTHGTLLHVLRARVQHPAPAPEGGGGGREPAVPRRAEPRRCAADDRGRARRRRAPSATPTPARWSSWSRTASSSSSR